MSTVGEVRKRPVFALVSVLLLLGVVPLALLAASAVPGMGAVLVFILAIGGGLVLGVLSAVVALVRGEPWRGVQVTLLVVYGLASYPLASTFLRGADPPPLPSGVMAADGQPSAFLKLAPQDQRIVQDKVRLAYPAADQPEGQLSYVLGQRDAQGVVTSVRAVQTAFEPAGPDEIRMQLMPTAGAWSLPRQDHIANLPGRAWKEASYLEVRINFKGWGVPAGVADAGLRPWGAPR